MGMGCDGGVQVLPAADNGFVLACGTGIEDCHGPRSRPPGTTGGECDGVG